MEQNLVDVQLIKTEITDTYEEVSLCIKHEEIADNELDKRLPMKTEIKSEDSDEIPKCDFVKHEIYNLPEKPDDFATTLKCEIKNEDTDCKEFEESIDLKVLGVPDIVTVTEGPSTTCCDRDSKDNIKLELQENLNPNSNRRQKIDEPSIGASKFKSDVTQQGNDMLLCCLHCDYSTNMKKNLVNHMLVHDKRNIIKNGHNSTDLVGNLGRDDNHSCNYCEKHFKRKMLLDQHIIQYHQNFIDSVSSKIHKCSLCDYKTTRTIYLKRHTIKIHSGNAEKHSCTCCEKHYSTKQLLDGHILKNHRNLIDLVSSKVHNCPICDYKTTMKSWLRRHMVKEHSVKDEEYSCTYCEKNFKRKIALDDHIMKNHENFIESVNSKVYNCQKCEYKTTVKDYLRRHTSRIHLENFKTYLCTSCEKHFKNRKSLHEHIVRHHQNAIDSVDSNIYNCPTCDYKTIKKSLLTHHIVKVHPENNEIHSCTWCEKYYKARKTLDNHIIRNHQDFINSVSSRIHSCTTCSYKTTERGYLRQHVRRAHSGRCEKYSYACTHCEKQFSVKWSLDDHILKSHPDFTDIVQSKIHSCTTCGYKTTMKCHLTGHMSTH